jgi:hypothetical protein
VKSDIAHLTSEVARRFLLLVTNTGVTQGDSTTVTNGVGDRLQSDSVAGAEFTVSATTGPAHRAQPNKPNCACIGPAPKCTDRHSDFSLQINCGTRKRTHVYMCRDRGQSAIAVGVDMRKSQVNDRTFCIGDVDETDNTCRTYV